MSKMKSILSIYKGIQDICFYYVLGFSLVDRDKAVKSTQLQLSLSDFWMIGVEIKSAKQIRQ